MLQFHWVEFMSLTYQIFVWVLHEESLLFSVLYLFHNYKALKMLLEMLLLFQGTFSELSFEWIPFISLSVYIIFISHFLFIVDSQMSGSVSLDLYRFFLLCHIYADRSLNS